MKRIKKISLIILSICLLVGIVPQEALAASGKVAVSSASGKVGSKVTVKCTVSVSGTSIGAADVNLSYDSSALEAAGTSTSSGLVSATGGGVTYTGAASSDGKKSLSFSVTFKIRKEGTFPIKVSYFEVSDWDKEEVIPNMSSSNGAVTGKAVSTDSDKDKDDKDKNDKDDKDKNDKDKNSKLASLQVSPGTLSPSFAAETTQYTISVPTDTKKVTISATPQSTKATVSVSGGTNLKAGSNQAKVIVTAEDSSTTVYEITIICGEAAKVKIGDVEYTIQETFSDKKVPTGFIKGQMKYEERLYDAVKHEFGELYMFYLKGPQGSRFFIYDKSSTQFHPFVQIKMQNGHFLIPMPLEETNQEFSAHEKTQIVLNDQEFEAWKLDGEYSIICAMNQEGRTVLYQHDRVDGTLQRYMSDLTVQIPVDIPAKVVKETPKTKLLSFVARYHLYIILGLLVLVIALLVMYICIVATSKENRSSRRRRRRRRNKDE